MRRILSGLAVMAFGILAFGTAGMAEDAAPPPLSAPDNAYRERERAARENYLSQIDLARTKYGEGTPEYQAEAKRAADEYRDRVSAAAGSQPGAAMGEGSAPVPADEGGEYVEEQNDWDYVKEKTKEGGRAVGRGAEKAGDAIGHGAKRVGRFFKDGYEDVKSNF